MTVYVGMDVHRKRSQVAIVDAAGVPQRNRNLANDPAKLVPVLGALPPGTPVAFEAAYGWGWLVELLEELELEPHLVHPSRCKAIASARLKNDKVDAAPTGDPSKLPPPLPSCGALRPLGTASCSSPRRARCGGRCLQSSCEGGRRQWLLSRAPPGRAGPDSPPYGNSRFASGGLPRRASGVIVPPLASC